MHHCGLTDKKTKFRGLMWFIPNNVANYILIIFPSGWREIERSIFGLPFFYGGRCGGGWGGFGRSLTKLGGTRVAKFLFPHIFFIFLFPQGFFPFSSFFSGGGGGGDGELGRALKKKT